MDADQLVIVIGASGIDIKGQAAAALQMGRSNSGVIRTSVGGVARNIAENLARLEVSTLLLSTVGHDQFGNHVLEHTATTGVDVSHVLRVPDMHTGSYVTILDDGGKVVVAISEYDIVEQIAPRYLQQQRALFAAASMIVIDANLSERTMASAFLWAERYNVPVCADPTSPALAERLIPHLPALTMVAPDAAEAAIMCGAKTPPATSEQAIETAQCLVSRGVKIAIVTLAEQGVAYADGSSAGHIPAIATSVVDTTGVGDALTAAVIFGLLNDMPLDDAMRLGVSAAALTLRTRETVSPDLTLDQLYDDLVV
jgi:pseudouridine kinase